jgi:uncharacterized protein YcbK (DUF882 family)
MATAKYVTALLAFAVGITVGSMANAQTPGVVPHKPPPAKSKMAPTKQVNLAPAKPAARPAAKPATTRTAAKPVTKPARLSASGKSPAATRQAPGTKPVQRVASRPAGGGSVMRSVRGGRAASSRPPSTIRGTRYGAVPVMMSPYAPPTEKLPPPPDDGSPRTLSFYAVNTQESLTVTFWRDGRYVQSELDRLNAFLRDSHNGDLVQMDPQLFDILWYVQRNLGAEGVPYQVLSAYRSPQTNAWLASSSRGVASDSLHMRGQAIDIRLPGRTPYQIRQAARELQLGGVGYYPRSGFVHIDTGPVRYW